MTLMELRPSPPRAERHTEPKWSQGEPPEPGVVATDTLIGQTRFDIVKEGDVCIFVKKRRHPIGKLPRSGSGEGDSEDGSKGHSAWPKDPSDYSHLPHAQFVVSNKILTGNCKAYKNMKIAIRGYESELRRTSDFDPYHEWDVGAAYTVLNVLHGKGTRKPLLMTLERLANIAHVIDELWCHDALSDMFYYWYQILDVKNSRPENGRDIMLVYTLMTFQHDDIPDWMNRKMYECWNNKIPDFDLSFLEEPVAKLNGKRDVRIAVVLKGIQHLVLCYSGSAAEHICTADCTSRQLGALVKWLTRHGLYPNEPIISPFEGISYITLCEAVRDMEEPEQSCPKKDTSCAIKPKLLALLEAQLPDLPRCSAPHQEPGAPFVFRAGSPSSPLQNPPPVHGSGSDFWGNAIPEYGYRYSFVDSSVDLDATPHSDEPEVPRRKLDDILKSWVSVSERPELTNPSAYEGASSQN